MNYAIKLQNVLARTYGFFRGRPAVLRFQILSLIHMRRNFHENLVRR